MKNFITIRGAREHNLKNINLDIPKNKFVVITGLSGSGKSSIAFDTIYAEGQRRYLESLSSYARQFLGMKEKPKVDKITGLSPAISIEQKTTNNNPRSTVGTITEIYDYLRLLFARAGKPHCPVCKKLLENQTIDQLSEKIQTKFQSQKISILSPIVREKKGTYETLFDNLQKDGFTRVRIDGIIYRLDEIDFKLERYKKHTIEIVIDRLKLPKFSKNPSESIKEIYTRLVDSIEISLKRSNGLVNILTDKSEELFSIHATCYEHDITFGEIEPRIFSFNTPFGACPGCSGLGVKKEFDVNLIIPDDTLSISEGAIKIWQNLIDSWRAKELKKFAKLHNISLTKPWKDLSKKHQDLILYNNDTLWEGIIPLYTRLYIQTDSEKRREQLDKFMQTKVCYMCHGKRLNDKVLSILIAGKNIIDITDMDIDDAKNFFDNLKLSKKDLEIVGEVIKEIKSRFKFLYDVGLGYLTLSRSAGTLSGGESQRIRLATQIGSNLTGVLYVLDEPSIGLHQKDNDKLIKSLLNLRDLGNTLIVVEHDEDTMQNADYIIDIGPGAGIYGGNVIFSGTYKQILKDKNSLTGKYLSKRLTIDIPKSFRKPKGFIEINGATENNLKNINIKFPTRVLCAITGVSGSGKSTLVNEILYKSLMKEVYNSKLTPGSHKSIKIHDKVDKVICITQEPIGRTPRSNPATYTKVFDHIRQLFAQTKDAKIRGYTQSRFSFNVRGGRCEACGGEGEIKIEMNFLPNVYVKCDVCKGSRYNKETLEVKYKNHSISDVLNLSVIEAYNLFKSIPILERKLKTLLDVGLDYISLGQSSVTLSGGEAQRIKIARELSKQSRGHTVYILDEPTTGLHFDDVKKLIHVLNRLVDTNNSVYVIEHNLDVIKCVDYIIDLGPNGGKYGGEIIATGTPLEVIKIKKSATGQFLKKVLN